MSQHRKRRLHGATIVSVVLDLVGAVLLAFYALIVGPLGVLRGPIVIERAGWYFWVLAPQGLLARTIRVAIDWRLGNFETAIAQLEGLVSLNEEYFKARQASRSRKRVLEDLYVLLARAYLHAGCIDDAMLVVIRAKKCMGIERLGGLAKIDAKTAHLVRAGLAAGRLLDGGGLTTMFVKTAAKETRSSPTDGAKPSTPAGSRAGASRHERPAASSRDADAEERGRDGSGCGDAGAGGDGACEDADGHGGGKVIPFPLHRDEGV